MPAAATNKPELVLITDEFPYSYKEASFLRPELDALAEAFSITLISKSASKTQILPVKDGIRVLHYDRPSVLTHLPAFLLLPFDKDLREEWGRIKSEKAPAPLKNLLLSGYFITESRFFFRFLKRNGLLRKDAADLYYSYWNNYALYALAKGKAIGYIDAPIVGRTHGYDLYPERQPFGRQPMKQQTDRRIDRMFCISEQGLNFYKDRFSVAPDHVKLARLGTPDRGIAKVKEGHFRLLTLSACVPVKRIELVIAALSLIRDVEIEWTHYGDGPLLQKLSVEAKQALGPMPNIRFSFPGAVENEELMKRLPAEGYDLLLNVSSSEGVPVSCMEALSMGIPVLATAVGGTPELIDPSCGGLLAPDSSPQMIADSILSFAAKKKDAYGPLRDAARKRWESMCSAKNFSLFLEELLALVSGN